ncbi:MAG: hypothetical protein MRZ61_10255 [Oscillospiraceae bacterium]|nr:hypothetical protein [Oscillospiraceae bacterium]
MDDYKLKSGEVLNGGYSVTIGDYTLRLIGGYRINWTNEYDTANQFTDYKGDPVRILRGRRFSLELSTGRLSVEDCKALISALKSETIAVSCPDFTGNCYSDAIPAKLEQANFLGTRYSSGITLTACELDKTGIGDGL